MPRSARFLRTIADGSRLRCPACRRGRMSPGLFRMHDACPGCRIPFVPGPGEQVGGVEIALYGTVLLGLLGNLALLVAGAPAWVAFAWAIGFGVVFPLFTYRHAKGAWIGAMYAMKPWALGGDEPHVAPIALPATPWDDV